MHPPCARHTGRAHPTLADAQAANCRSGCQAAASSRSLTCRMSAHCLGVLVAVAPRPLNHADLHDAEGQ